MIRRHLVLPATAVSIGAAMLLPAASASAPADTPPVHQIGHVWTIVLENEEFEQTS